MGYAVLPFVLGIFLVISQILLAPNLWRICWVIGEGHAPLHLRPRRRRPFYHLYYGMDRLPLGLCFSASEYLLEMVAPRVHRHACSGEYKKCVLD